MSITFQALAGQLRMDVGQWQSGINQAKGGLSGLLSHVNGVSNAIANRLAGIGTSLAGLSVGGILGAAKAVKMASDAQEQATKFDYVFRESAAKTRQELDRFAAAAGRSRHELQGFAADFGSLLGPMGIGATDVARMSVGLSKLAVDLSSFHNVREGDAMIALRAGIVGEIEPLRRLGVNLSAVKIEREAARLGLIRQTKSMAQANSETLALTKAEQALMLSRMKYGPNSLKFAEALAAVQRAEEKLGKQSKISVEQLDPAIRARAAYSIILKETAVAQGDAIRTGGNFANMLRRLSANVKDLAIDFGGPLLRAATQTISIFDRMVTANRGLVMGFADWLGNVLNAKNVAGFWDAVFALVNRAYGAFQKAKGVAVELGKTLKPLWGSLPDLVKLAIILGSVGKALEAVGGRIPFLGGALGGIGALLNPLGMMLPIIRKLIPFIISAGAAILGMMGPIGWAAAAIAALVGGITWLAARSEKFGPQMGRIWDKLGEVFFAGLGLVKDAFAEIGKAFGMLVNLDIDKIKGWWKAFSDGAVGAFGVVLTAFEGLLDLLTGRGSDRIEAAWLKITGTIKAAMGAMLKEVGESLKLGFLSKAGEKMIAGGAADAQAAEEKLAAVAARDKAEAEAKAAAEAAKNAKPGTMPFGQVLGRAGGRAPAMNIGTKSGIIPFFGERAIDPMKASPDELRSATGRLKRDVGRQIRGNAGEMTREDRAAAASLGERAVAASRAVANAPLSEREGRLAEAQAAFNEFQKFMQAMALGKDEVSLLRDAMAEAKEATKAQAAANEALARNPADAQAKADLEAATKRLAELEDATAIAKKFGLDAEIQTANDRKKAHAEEMKRRQEEFKDRHNAGKKAAKDVADGGKEAADAIKGAGDDVAGAMKDAEAQRQQADFDAWAEEQSKTVDAFAPMRNALDNFGNGLNAAAVALGRTFGREAELYRDLTPEQQLRSLLGKKAQELKGAEMNLGFLNRGFGFGGVQSTSDQSRNISTQQTRIANLRADIASIQRQLSSGQGGVAAMGSPDVKGGMSAADAIRGGTAGQGLGSQTTYGDTNIAMTVNTQQVEPGKLFDAMDAEAKKRGVDATGRSPLRKQSRGPINSRIR